MGFPSLYWRSGWRRRRVGATSRSRLYAATGHRDDPGMAHMVTEVGVLDDCMVFDHLNDISRLLSWAVTSPLVRWRVGSKAAVVGGHKHLQDGHFYVPGVVQDMGQAQSLVKDVWRNR